MAATTVAEQVVLGAYAKEADTPFTTLTMTATDATNMNKIVMSTGRCLVIWQNADAANAEWVTVDASDDPYGRSTNITQHAIPASGWLAFLFEPRGWEQTLGGRNIEFTANHAEVLVAAIAL